MRPGAWLLAVDSPIGLGNGVKLHQAVPAFGLNVVGKLASGPVAINHAIKNSMHHMNALRRKLPGHALR